MRLYLPDLGVTGARQSTRGHLDAALHCSLAHPERQQRDSGYFASTSARSTTLRNFE